MTLLNFRSPVLLAIVLASPPAVRAQAQSPPVSALELRGASDPSLIRHMAARVGAPVDPETIRSSVLLLSAMNLFDEVWVEQETEPDGTLRLVFNVTQTPRLGRLLFVATSAEGRLETPLDPTLVKALTEASGLRTSETFRDQLPDASIRMTDWLRAHAYPNARAELEVLPEESGRDSPRLVRDIKVRVPEATQETLVRSRIDGWPQTLAPPQTPGSEGAALTVETLTAWKEILLSRLWKGGYYRAQVRTDSVRGDLVFFVSPGPLFDLKLDRVTAKERPRARARFEAEGLSQDAIEETMSTIESEYVQRGYRDVQVDFQEVPQGDRVSGGFVVRAGSAWYLGAVEYQTDGVPSPSRGSGLTPGGPWIDADIDAEKARLLEDLLQKGYAGATVSHEESGNPATAKVIFKVVPGSLATVGSVVIKGAPRMEAGGQGSAVALVTREALPFRVGDVAQDRTSLLTALRDDGYLDARVEVTTDFSDDRSRVSVTFHVVTGPRVRVGRILVVGLEDTKETVVFRESRLKEGDYLSYQKLLDTQAGLSATGLFRDVQIREIAEGEEIRNLIIEVKEGPRTTIVPGLGFAENDKARASLELTRLNIAGRGRTASMFLRGSVKGSSRAVLSLTEPYAFGRRQAINLSAYWDDDRSRKAFDFHRLGLQAQTVFPHRAGSVLAQYTFQNTTTSRVATDCAEINRDLCDGRVSGPSLGFVHDTRNDALDPRRGTLYSVETLISLTALGGDSFVKGSAFIARYEEIRAGVVLAASARLGLSRAFGSSVELPLPERFFAGGASLMRGFGTDEVGPGRFNDVGLFIPAGGNALLAAAMEARVAISRSWGFQVFGETGNVFSRASAIRLGRLREVTGIGLTYRSPFGPLRLDWGFKLDRQAGESLQHLHVGVGYAF